MLDQGNRLLRLRSPLGDDACVVIAFSGSSHVSDVYRYQLTIQTKGRRIPAGDIIGLAVTLEMKRHAQVRFFHGIVDRWIDIGVDADGTLCYQLDMVPRMALLEHARHNRIFENMSTIDIVKQVLGECGERPDCGQLQAYTRREICTQYAETDLQFVNRLLLEEGIAYFFRHDSDRYSCILVDSAAGFGSTQPESFEFVPQMTGVQHDAIIAWQRQSRVGNARLSSTDYSEYCPATPLSTTADSRNAVNRTRFGEVQLHGQHYFERQSAGLRQFNVDTADRQLERWQIGLGFDVDHIEGASNIGGLDAGLRLTVRNPRPDQHAEVLLVCVQHEAADGNELSTFYRNTFVAVDAAAGYAPHRYQLRPQISGTHSASVVEVKDPVGEGALAEVRIKFPWEPTQASCWARVAQLYAGNRWGSYFVPEVGQEVLVEFLNGDPDRPVVIGALYNRDNRLPPYTRTQSGLRTRSKNFSELRFDDRDGNEEVFFQAGKDHNYHINNDQTGVITNNRRATIDNGNDETIVSSGSQSSDVAGNITLTAGQSITLQVGGSVIRIEPASITLQATLISLQASAQIEIEAGAVTDIEGGVVRINS